MWESKQLGREREDSVRDEKESVVIAGRLIEPFGYCIVIERNDEMKGGGT